MAPRFCDQFMTAIILLAIIGMDGDPKKRWGRENTSHSLAEMDALHLSGESSLTLPGKKASTVLYFEMRAVAFQAKSSWRLRFGPGRGGQGRDYTPMSTLGVSAAQIRVVVFSKPDGGDAGLRRALCWFLRKYERMARGG